MFLGPDYLILPKLISSCDYSSDYFVLICFYYSFYHFFTFLVHFITILLWLALIFFQTFSFCYIAHLLLFHYHFAHFTYLLSFNILIFASLLYLPVICFHFVIIFSFCYIYFPFAFILLWFFSVALPAMSHLDISIYATFATLS